MTSSSGWRPCEQRHGGVSSLFIITLYILLLQRKPSRDQTSCDDAAPKVIGTRYGRRRSRKWRSPSPMVGTSRTHPLRFGNYAGQIPGSHRRKRFFFLHVLQHRLSWHPPWPNYRCWLIACREMPLQPCSHICNTRVCDTLQQCLLGQGPDEKLADIDLDLVSRLLTLRPAGQPVVNHRHPLSFLTVALPRPFIRGRAALW